jgi:hypothetical protein
MKIKENDELNLFYMQLIEYCNKNKKVIIPLDEIKAIYQLKFDFYSDNVRWSHLEQWLSILQNQQKISYSNNPQNYDLSAKIPLPYQIKVKIERNNEATDNNYVWSPELLPFVDKKGIKQKTEENLIKIDQFLKKNRSKLIEIPIKERSLQIFGDEKYLDSFIKNRENGTELLKILKCFHTYEPIHGKNFVSYLHNSILILENRDTFYGFLKSQESMSKPYYRGVFYGQGGVILNSFHNIIKYLDESTQVYYFGDIDKGGITIAVNLIKAWREMEPKRQIEIANEYYAKIIDFYQKSGFSILATSKMKPNLPLAQISKESLSIFDSIVSEKIWEIMSKKERIPQEFLNYEEQMTIFGMK